MNFADISSAIRQQISASIIPECKWQIAALYGLVVLLFAIRIYTGEPYRQLFAYTQQYSQWDHYELDIDIPLNVRVGIRFIALLTAIITNMIPFLVPILLSSFFNRLQTQHNTRQGSQ
ncbi:putative integral membrane protein [Babesia bovis T2Bo]|uniref:putative integral membrane protein n=1 Tax=Babesia bovis T2Bo TaxID=484906 RepID=UPI001C343A9C|nr:putative integral membrane protein [Babesia bovis T2Bo]KAG6440172.1 putative integral membrane protein [Babesia bovis T2Bo]